jgi:sugar phosphate permease
MKLKSRIVFALWFGMLVNFLDRVAMSFAGPSIMRDLSMDPASFGIVLSSFGLGYVLAQIPGGMLADRWGARTMLVIGPIFWALFTGLTGLVSTLAGFVIVRICFGISESVAATSLPKIVGGAFSSKDRARVMAICMCAIPLAPAFAGALVGKLVTTYGWQAMFFIMAVPALLASLLAWLLLPAQPAAAPEPAEPEADQRRSLRSLLGRKRVWLLALVYFAHNIAYSGYLGWMPSYLALAHHIELKSLGPIASIPYVFGFLGMLAGGWLGSAAFHLRRPQLIAACLVLAGLSMFLAYRAETVPLTLAGLSGAAFCLFGTLGPLSAVSLDLAPARYRATLMGIWGTAAQLGGVVAPAVIGFLVSATGTFAGGFGFMIFALVAAAGGMLALIPLLAGSTAAPAVVAAPQRAG